MRPSEALQLHRSDIRNIVARNHACNPRVFGSVAHGNDTEGSDLDILVDPISDKTTLINLITIERELEQILGVRIDVQTPGSLSERFRNAVLMDALQV
jgi:predicted nucleotidyltransferase